MKRLRKFLMIEVSYFRERLHLRCLTLFKTRLCVVKNTIIYLNNDDAIQSMMQMIHMDFIASSCTVEDIGKIGICM